MNFEDLIKKYNLTFVNGNRMYIIDLDSNAISFENTTPYYFKFKNNESYENSWKNLLPIVFKMFDSQNPKSKSELLSLENTWGHQAVFSESKLSNYVEVKNGIYMNCNHTAIHSFMTLQLLVEAYGILKEDCTFVVKRQPISEPKEVRDYYLEQTKNKFKFYLQYVKKLSENSISTVIKNIEIVNRNFLQRISKGYIDFYLIEEPGTFFNYMKKTVDEVNKNMNYPDKVKQAIERELGFLYDFVRVDRCKRSKDMPGFLVDIDSSNEMNSDLDAELLKYIDLDDLI